MVRKRRDEPLSGDIGVGGLFRGIGSLVDLVSRLAEQGGEMSRTGELGDDRKGVKAVYGFSVRLAGEGKPVVERFGNVRDGGPGPVIDEVREPIVDVFDEPGHLLLVAELPGVTKEDVHFDVKDDVLHLSAARGERKYRKEVLLSVAVDGKSATSSFRNGVLEIKLPRAASARRRSQTKESRT